MKIDEVIKVLESIKELTGVKGITINFQSTGCYSICDIFIDKSDKKSEE